MRRWTWIAVRAIALTRDAIVSALDRGEFYASTGVTVKDIRSTKESITIEIEPIGVVRTVGERRYRVTFIGKSGRVLATSNENPARYAFKGDEGYVRVRIDDSNGLHAWTQPLFLTAAAAQ